jgi:hypothetical protein
VRVVKRRAAEVYGGGRLRHVRGRERAREREARKPEARRNMPYSQSDCQVGTILDEKELGGDPASPVGDSRGIRETYLTGAGRAPGADPGFGP